MAGTEQRSRRRVRRAGPAPLTPLIRDLGLVAAGDLSGDLDGGDTPAGQAIAEAVNQLLAGIRETLTAVSAARAGLGARWREVNEVAFAMLEGSETTARGATSATGTAGDVSAAMQAVASATEELAATIREVATHASVASAVAHEVAGQAVTANTALAQLETCSQDIQQVVDLVAVIARQTHLLALNATIEAVRAGEAGLGFTVVATEVKALAAQTSSATTTVTGSVTAIQDGAQAAAGMMQTVTDTIARVVDNQTAIASAVEQQTATTQQIGQDTAAAAMGAVLLADSVQELLGAVRATAYAGAQARTVAGQLCQTEGALQEILSRYTFSPGLQQTVAEPLPVAITVGDMVIIDNGVLGTGLHQLDYGPHWRHSKRNVETGGTNSYCSIPGDAVTLRFRGRRVAFYGVLEPNHGIGALSLDGGPETLIDQYAPSREARKLWESPTLDDTEHTLTFRVTGQLNPLSRYIWTTVDRFDITL